MKKSDLKNGAIVQTKWGDKYIKIDNVFLSLKMNGDYLDVRAYTDDLRYIYSEDNQNAQYDIMKINNNVSPYNNCASKALVEALKDIWTWDRNIPILTDKEKQYLKNIIEPFKEKIIGIEKLETVTKQEYLDFILKDSTESFELPFFPKGEYYKGMDQETIYSLQNLDLL